MAWTAPATVVTGEIVVAAWWNAQVRDNLLETSPAKASAAGDLFVGTGANAVKRLAKGAARQVPQINSGATDIEWAPSPQSVLTAQADLLYTSAANTLARLAKGTARQNLAINAGETAPEWVASLQSLLTAAGAIIIASGANTPAELAKGSARQALVMNAGGTLPEWADVFLKLAGGTMAGAIAMGTNKITGLDTPTDAADAATKGYVDGITTVIATGSYAGNDAAPRTITVGFTPKYAIVSGDGSSVRVGIGHHSNGQYGLTAGAAAAAATTDDSLRPDPTADGFIVSQAGSPTLNNSGSTYYWTAIA